MKLKNFNIKKKYLFVSLFIVIFFFGYLFYNIVFMEEGYNKGSGLIKSIDPNDTTFQGNVALIDINSVNKKPTLRPTPTSTPTSTPMSMQDTGQDAT